MVSPCNIGAMPNQRLGARVLPTILFVVVLTGAISLEFMRARGAARRAEYVSNLPEWSSNTPETEAGSATGYQAGQRIAIVPGHDKLSFAMVANAQQMLARGEFRVERVDNENTPAGHVSHLASVYPWVLAATAAVDHRLGGRPAGRAVEAVALLINPGLLLLGLVAGSLLTARVFGLLSGALLAAGMAVLYPFAAAFVPGAPNPVSLQVLVILFSLLAMLAGGEAARRTAGTAAGEKTAWAPAPIWFVAGGITGGLGLWLDLPGGLPFIGGLAAAGLLLALFSRAPAAALLPWRAWGLAGAGTLLAGYFIDYFPARGTGALHYLHPLYAVAWVGAAEVILLAGRFRHPVRPWNARRAALAAVAAVALLQLPVALARTHTDLYTPDGPDALRIDPVSSVAAPGVSAWLKRDGLSSLATATLLPLLLIPWAVGLLFRVDASRRVVLGLALGPVILGLAAGLTQLSYWPRLDVALLALAVALAASLRAPPGGWLAPVNAGVFLLTLLPGLGRDFRPVPADAPLSPVEFESYVERDLAHWLRQHAPETPAVLAPPRVTSALCFYGGLAGLGTFDRDNQAGTSAAIRIVSALSVEEAQALVDARKLTHIVIPFWDSYLDTYVRLGAGKDAGAERIDASLLSGLQHWKLPPWLRPIPYRLPAAPGVDGLVVIYAVVDEQSPPVALARLVEYLLEMDQLESAREKARELAEYPNDWGALAAGCQVAAATNDGPGLETARERLYAALARPEHRRLAWDRRVSVAITLAQQKRHDLARPQMETCLGEIDADKLRSLTTVSLYRFDLLCKNYGLEIQDPALRALSRSLLRPDLRSHL